MQVLKKTYCNRDNMIKLLWVNDQLDAQLRYIIRLLL